MPFDREPAPTALRVAMAGSVDDGKSTLIGRLLHDAGAVPEDELARLARQSAEGEPDFALLTDGLAAEREQGITIDVAYRHLTTPRRRLVIADAPGHEQYTRNMATAASTADAAIVLVSAATGVTDQTRRHLSLAHLLGVGELIVAVNKMDLAGFAEARFAAIVKGVTELTTALGAPQPRFVPMAARFGDNVVHPSARMPWYGGAPLLALLETLPPPRPAYALPFRMPVQLARRPTADGTQRRRYLGRIEAGEIAVGDPVQVLPGGSVTRVRGIRAWPEALEAAAAPRSVAIELADEVDVTRGDILAALAQPPRVADRLEATLCWFADAPPAARARHLLKIGTRTVDAEIAEVRHFLDIRTLALTPAAAPLRRNDIARVRLRLAQPVVFDRYREIRATGAFILMDEASNATVAAGMIED